MLCKTVQTVLQSMARYSGRPTRTSFHHFTGFSSPLMMIRVTIAEGHHNTMISLPRAALHPALVIFECQVTPAHTVSSALESC